MAIYTIPCLTLVGCSCGGDIPCNLCDGITTLNQFADLYAWGNNQTPDNQFPFLYPGNSFTGIINVASSDIAIFTTGSDTYLKRTGCGNTGSPYVGDDAEIYFDGVNKQNFTISYEYYLQNSDCVSGGKHRIKIAADFSDFDSSNLNLGSWSDNGQNSIGMMILEKSYNDFCIFEYPPTEIPNFILPQTLGQWRTRIYQKQDNVITITDGSNTPIVIERCWFPLIGDIGLIMGPGVRIRNISITI